MSSKKVGESFFNSVLVIFNQHNKFDWSAWLHTILLKETVTLSFALFISN